MKVRILSFLLTLCMVLTLVPAVAFADGTTVNATEVSSTDAFKAALASGAQSVKLTGDVTFVGTIANDVKIDLNGKKLSGTIITDGTVTIVDNGSGTIDADVVEGEGTLVIESAGKVADKLLPYVSNTSTIAAAGEGFSKVAVGKTAEICYQVGNKKFVRWTDAINAATNPVVKIIQNVLFTETITKSVTIEVETAYPVNFTAPKLEVVTGATVNFVAGSVKIDEIAGAGKVVMGDKVGSSVVMAQTTAPANATAENFEIKGGQYAFDASAFLAEGLTQVNNLVVDNVADYVAYVGVKGYSLATLDEAVKQAGASGTPIILVRSLDKVIEIPAGYAVTIELNGCTITSVIENNGALTITDTLNTATGTAEQIINNGALTLKGGFIVRVENLSATSTMTLDGAKLSILDNYSTAANSVCIKSGIASEAIANTYVDRKWFYENAGFAAVVDHYAAVTTYVAFIGNVGYATVDEAKAAIEAITATGTVTVYAEIANIAINGNVTVILGTNGALKNVTVNEGKTLTVNYGDTPYTYGAGVYEEIVMPVCYIVVNGENVYYTSIQDAIDAIPAGTKATIEVIGNFTGEGAYISTGIDVTIDLNGYTYTINKLTSGNGSGQEVGVAVHNVDAKVTLTNGTIALAETVANGDGTSNVENWVVASFADTITVTDVNIKGNANTKSVFACYYGNAVLNGTTSITATGTTYVGIYAYHMDPLTVYEDSPANVVINTTGTINGRIVLSATASIAADSDSAITFNNGIVTGAFEVANGAPANFVINGGTYTGLTYEKFYGYIGENIAHINEDGSLTINNENVYEAEYNGIKYLTVAAAIAKAANKGTVYLLKNFTDLTVDNDQMIKLEVGNNTIANLTKTGEGELKVMSGKVTGTLTVSEGLVTVYSAKTTFVLDSIVVADEAELKITTGTWYVAEMKDILAYVPAAYDVKANVDEDEVTYFTLEATDPQAAILNAENEQIVRVDTLENAIEYVLDEESEYYGLTIELINGDYYYIDLANGESVTIINTVKADIEVAFEGELEQVTLVEGDVYTGYTAVAKVLDQGVYYSFKTVAEAVAYADGYEWMEVTTYADVDEAFTVEEVAYINGEYYGVGEYAGLEEYDAVIYRADSDTTTRYATLADAVSAAYDGERIDLVRDVTEDTINLDGKTIIVYAGTSKAEALNIGTLTVEGEGSIRINYAIIEKVECSSGATFNGSYYGTIGEIVWENGAIGIRGNAGKVTVKNATVNISNNAVIDELTFEGNIHFETVGDYLVKDITLTDVTFSATSSIATGSYYGLNDAELAVLSTIAKEGYVLNKTVDADDVVYHKVVNAADFVAIVDGYYFTEIDEAIEFADGEIAVQLLVDFDEIVVDNDLKVIFHITSMIHINEIKANDGYFLLSDMYFEGLDVFFWYESVFKMAEAETVHDGEILKVPFPAINDAIAAGYTKFVAYGREEFTVPAGKFVQIAFADANNTLNPANGTVFYEVYGEGTYTEACEYNVAAKSSYANTVYVAADLQTLVDFANANYVAITVKYVTNDQEVVIDAPNAGIIFDYVADSVVDLTIVNGVVILTSGRFTGDYDKAYLASVVAYSLNGDVKTVYSSFGAVEADAPENIYALTNIAGLTVDFDTCIYANRVLDITSLNVVDGATVTLAGLFTVYTNGLTVGAKATLLIADSDVWFDSDIYTGKDNVLAAVEGTYADMWLFVEEDGYYYLAPSAVGFNNKGYANILDALAAAKKADGVITFYSNQEFTKSQAIADVEIDLNDYTLKVVDLTVSGTVVISNGTVAVAKNEKSYGIQAKAATKASTGTVLELNNVTVQSGSYFDSYTGKKVAVELGDYSTLTGTDITLIGGINVYADPQKPATLNVDGEINFVNAIYYKFSNKSSLICVNHAMTDNHDCAYCGEKAVKVVLGGDATIIGAEADEDGAYWFFAGEKVTLKHGKVEPGKHFARWTVEGGASYINADVDLNELVIVAGETRYAYVAAQFEANNAVTVQISAPYFNVTGLTSAQIGNVVITASAGAKITVTYTDPTNGLFGDILYWINDNGAIIGTDNVLEYTVPTTGGTITAICSSATAGQDITVVFQNGAAKIGAKVLNYAKYTTADLANLYVPALPALGSQNVIGWSLDGTTALENPAEIVAAIEAAIAAGKSKIVFVPAIEVPEYVTVDVVVNGEVVDSYEVNPTVYSVINTTYAEEGMVLSHWVLNGKVEVYTDALIAKFTADTVVEAVFVEEIYGVDRDVLVDFGGCYADDEKVVFEAIYQLPEGFTMTDAGIVYTTDETLDDDDIVINSDGNVKVKHVNGLGGSNAATYTLTLNFKNGFKNVRAVAFVSFVDADGNAYVMYSDVISANEYIGD